MTVTAKPSSHPLVQAWLVLFLSVLYGAALAYVHSSLSPKIAENIRQETYSLIPSLVGSPGNYDKAVETPVELPDGSVLRIYQAQDAQGAGLGWVIPASALGFADRILLLVGVDAACERITGMRVIDQKETPGLGNLIVMPAFTSQFSGKSTETALEVVKTAPTSANQVRSVTGATISSVTVADAVNQALQQARPFIAGLNAASSTQP
jgi:electron transport complex protein RnfG